MAETRSKARARGDKGQANIRNNFISTLSKKYKPGKSYEKNDNGKYSPGAKKFKSLVDEATEARKLFTCSQPFPLRTNHDCVSEGKENIFGMRIEWEENPLNIECDVENKDSNSAECKNKNVIDDTQKSNETNGEKEPATGKDLDVAEPHGEDELLILSPENNVKFEDDGKFTKQDIQNLLSSQSRDELEVHGESQEIVKDYAPRNTSQPSCSGQKRSPISNEKSACACSVKLIRSHGKLIKISEELKNISNIIENIKTELERYTK